LSSELSFLASAVIPQRVVRSSGRLRGVTWLVTHLRDGGAAPVLDRTGHLAAILGVQGPAVRFSPRAMRTAVELLTEKAALISSAL
jgi:hypothetical protein